MGKMGKDTIFPWAKMGLDPPPQFLYKLPIFVFRVLQTVGNCAISVQTYSFDIDRVNKSFIIALIGF